MPSQTGLCHSGRFGARGSAGAGWWGAYGWVVEFLVLGPVEVYSGDKSVHVGGVKQRSILALLIACHGQVVSADRIVDEVYGEDAVAGARRSVQSIVSMLRRDLGDVIVGTGEGYRFDTPRTAVDAYRFEDGVAAGLELLRAEPRQASSVFDEALGLWRGDPYSDVDGRGVFEPEVARLTELRFAALEARAEADLACGRHREVLAELEALVGEFPVRERLWGWLMLALYRTGRQADALAAYQRARTVLGEELGLEPSTELRELEEQILLQDPALDLVPTTPHNLPASLTSFVGRALELIELGELLTEKRLVTLTGAGGSGKTRLAVELGRKVLDDYPDGVWFVDLRGVDVGGVAPLIASTLGVVTSDDTPLTDQLINALAPRRRLLVLDNCEHVLSAVGPFVGSLMARGGHVRVLATSREPLGVPGESRMNVHPLPLPESASSEELVASDAVALFTERAGSAQPDFALEEHVDAVCEICRSVDGLPLALELAAARLVAFSPEELADRLDDQLSTLRTTRTAGDLRHATIESTIAWSWGLLSDAERALMTRLSIFHGTWSLEAAETICGFEPISRDQAVDLVASVVAKSLVVVDGVSRGSTRYLLLEPIRQYAGHKLDEQATEHLHSRSVDYWSTTMAALYVPDTRVAWLDYDQARALEPDQANLTAAIEWALESKRFSDAMVILGSPFGRLLMLQGSAFEVASGWMDTALQHRDAISPGPLLWALEAAGSIAAPAGRIEMWLGYATLGIEMSRSIQERHWFELSAAIATIYLKGHTPTTDAMFDRVIDQTDDPGMQASALLAKAKLESPSLAWALMGQAMELSPIDSLGYYDELTASVRILDSAGDCGRYDVATQLAERALELSRQSGWVMVECQVASALTWLYAARGRLDEAAALIAEVVPTARRIIGPTMSKSIVPRRAASVARQQGHFDEARSYAEESRLAAEQTETGERGETSTLWAIRELGLVARDEGNLEQARGILDDALRRLEDFEHASLGSWIRAELCTTRASVELRRGDPDQALEDLTEVLAVPDVLYHADAVLAIDLTAIALAQQGRAEQAARLLGAVDHERERAGLVARPPDRSLREAAVLDTQSILKHEWESALTEGRLMSLDDALFYAAAQVGAVEYAPAVTPDTASGTSSLS